MKEKRALKKDEKAIKEKQNKELININRLRQKERKRSKKEKGTKR